VKPGNFPESLQSPVRAQRAIDHLDCAVARRAIKFVFDDIPDKRGCLLFFGDLKLSSWWFLYQAIPAMSLVVPEPLVGELLAQVRCWHEAAEPGCPLHGRERG
jgi:hypothetical protein